MIRTGDTLENPVTGERIFFRRSARDTGGEAVLIEVSLRPGAFVPGTHVHPHQEERFHVLRGSVGFRVGRRKILAGPGERLSVPAGTPHRFWNAGDGEARFETEVRPALRFEQLLETMVALARDGKTDGRGLPNPFRLAVIGRDTFDTVRLPYVPASAQRMGLGVLGAFGRLLGYGPVYLPRAARPGLAAH